jgi:uncharacterized cupredoxin-like copper-binding protein
MQKRWSRRLAVLAVAGVLVVTGCSGSGEKDGPQELGAVKEVAALRAPMAESITALAEVKARVEQGDAAGLQAAYDRFAAAFGQVLGPVSFEDTGAAQRMANANTRIVEALATKEPGFATVAEQADVLAREMSRTAQTLGLPVMATASARVGAAVVAATSADGQVAQRAPRVIEVTAREYRFTPARIEVKKGERVTVRLRNAGTEKHEWELDAFGVEIKPISPGKTGEVTFTADHAGTFEFACHVDGHYAKGMIGFLIVR